MRLADESGWTIAHVQASWGWTTDDLEILKLASEDGWTVAHEQAFHGWTTDDPEILSLRERNNGWTVEHIIKVQSVLRSIENEHFFTDTDTLKVPIDEFGWTVAHEQADHGWTTENKEILQLRNDMGITVAHVQAMHGWTTDDIDILLLSNKFGWTVAHEQAMHGWVTDNKRVLRKRTITGESVYDIIQAGKKENEENKIK